MSAVDALAQTATIISIIGGIGIWLGLGIWLINERRVGAPIAAVGGIFVVAAIAAWIVCIWMQVRS
jgi:hypothetical protein